MTLPSVRELPAAPGVYRFRDTRGRALYLGRATNLRTRVGSYWGPLRGRRHLIRMVAQIGAVEAIECDSVHEAAWLERLLMQRSKPRWNRVVGGLENPVLIRLNTSLRAPGLSLVHEAVSDSTSQFFGPYLGGNRLRLALRAIERVLPLSLTAQQPAGTLSDFARLRSVEPWHRERLIEQIVAVLQRDSNAIATANSELAVLRDASAFRLEFERAATLQAELEAFTWLVAPQRVMAREGGDAVFTGWADGVAVDLRMTAGAIDGWTVRPSSQSAAERRRATTPSDWREYADRAAQLASRLASFRA